MCVVDRQIRVLNSCDQECPKPSFMLEKADTKNLQNLEKEIREIVEFPPLLFN